MSKKTDKSWIATESLRAGGVDHIATAHKELRAGGGEREIATGTESLIMAGTAARNRDWIVRGERM